MKLTLRQRISKLRIAVLPDFFLDRIVAIPTIKRFFGQLELKAAMGGGNLRGLAQTEVVGGNAGNLAFALSALSAKTTYFCVGDSITRAVTSQQNSTCQIRLIEGKPGYTTALEFPYEGKRVNVMLSDVGDIANFDGRKLTKEDLRCLEKSDCIALVNWSANTRGNELVKRVFSLKGRRRPLNFLDLADPQGEEHRIKLLAKNIIARGLVDVLSLNENEARIMLRLVSSGKLARSYRPHDVIRASKTLHDTLQIMVDLHTPIGSATSTDEGETWLSSLGSMRGVVTGAGDVWDAGDIIGHLLKFEDCDRLRFANACAYLYITNRGHRYPTLSQVRSFLSSRA